MHLLSIGLIILLAACDNESALVPVSPEPEIPEETAYLSMSVNVGDALTTRAYTGTSPGEKEEYFVQGVRLVLYNGKLSSSLVVKSIDYDIKNDDGGSNWWTGKGLAPVTNQSQKEKFVTLAEAVPNMDYYALVLVNPTTDMKSVTNKGNTFADFDKIQLVEASGKTADVGGLAKDKNFFMTNAQDLVLISKSVYLHNTITAAHNKPVPVSVERIVAKVTLVTDGTLNVPCEKQNARAGNLTWGLDITNKKTFWMRKATGNVNDPVENWYAVDPNYTQWGSKTENERKTEFFYYLSEEGKSPAVLPKTLNKWEYCLENTMDAGDQASDKVATRVLIRCAYKPEKITTLGEGYYVISAPIAEVYSHQEIKTLLDIAKEEIATNTPLSEISKAVLALGTAGYDVSTGSVPKYGSSAVSESFQSANTKYYYQGVGYYAIKIQHFNENHYGVLRNTFYTVKLNSIKGPGAINLEEAGISTRTETSVLSGLYDNIDATITLNNQL